MKLDPRTEKCYPACELARIIKKEFGIERSHSTILRWMKIGRQGITLDSIPVGGQRISSIEAVERFFQKLSLEEEA